MNLGMLAAKILRDDQNGEWKIIDLRWADFRLIWKQIHCQYDETVSNIYSSHCIEHIEPKTSLEMFF